MKPERKRLFLKAASFPAGMLSAVFVFFILYSEPPWTRESVRMIVSIAASLLWGTITTFAILNHIKNGWFDNTNQLYPQKEARMKPAKNQDSYTRFWLSFVITLVAAAGIFCLVFFLPPWPTSALFLVLRILAGAVSFLVTAVTVFVLSCRYIIFGQGISININYCNWP